MICTKFNATCPLSTRGVDYRAPTRHLMAVGVIPHACVIGCLVQAAVLRVAASLCSGPLGPPCGGCCKMDSRVLASSDLPPAAPFGRRASLIPPYPRLKCYRPPCARRHRRYSMPWPSTLRGAVRPARRCGQSSADAIGACCGLTASVLLRVCNHVLLQLKRVFCAHRPFGST